MTPFAMGTTSSIIMQSLGKVAQCAPAVGAKMCCLFFLLVGCHDKLTVLILLSPSVTKNKHFRPCRKNYVLDRKMIDTFFNGLDVLYHHAKFGKDRTMRAGCRCENVVFVFYRQDAAKRQTAGIIYIFIFIHQ